MSYALDYLTDLYQEFGELWQGDKKQAERVVFGKAQAIEPRPTADMYAEVKRAIAGKETVTAVVDDCRPYEDNPLCKVVHLGGDKPNAGRVEYEIAVVELADEIEYEVQVKEINQGLK